jgi:hypothetical protein
MDKVKARKMYELATRLSNVNASELSEQQLGERNSMIARLQEEMNKLRETPSIKTSVVHKGSYGTSYDSGADDEDDEDLGYFKQDTSMPSGPKVRPNTQGRSPSQWSGKTPARIPFDEAGEDPSQSTHYNVNKLGQEIGIDPRQLRIAIQRSITGNPTRQDTLTVANAFISILQNGDDQTIQNIANIIKAGNPRKDPTQESAAPKATKAEEVKEEISTEAYDRLKKVFDFSNFKG